MVEKSAKTMQQARIAIRKGQLTEAKRLLRQLVRDDPQNHAAWLLLARATPSSKAAMEYVKRAEAVQPDSLLVQQARTGLEQKINGETELSHKPRGRTIILSVGLALLVALMAVWFGPMAWERVSAQRNNSNVEVVVITTLEPAVEADTPAEDIPASAPSLQPTPTVRPTVAADSSGNKDSEELEEADLAEEATVEPVAADPTGLRPYGVGPDDRWIDVDLNTQMLVAYEGNTQVYSSLISSGTWEYPTITGQYRTYVKYESQDMNGYLIGFDYYLQDVPHVMYFSGNFAIHGAYWHYNFGVPTSHGCVNVNPIDAGWLFDWAPVGTTVNIH